MNENTTITNMERNMKKEIQITMMKNMMKMIGVSTTLVLDNVNEIHKYFFNKRLRNHENP